MTPEKSHPKRQRAPWHWRFHRLIPARASTIFPALFSQVSISENRHFVAFLT